MSTGDLSAKRRKERERQYRLVDQSISMHAILRDRYSRRAFLLNTAQIAISLFLVVFAFVSDDVLNILGPTPEVVRLMIGLPAVLMVLVSMTEFRVDWRGVSARHADAVRQLAALKARYRSEQEGDSDLLTKDYNRLARELIPIPENHFVRLKAAHQFKVALSGQVSANPGVPHWLLAAKLRWRAILGGPRGERTTGHSGGSATDDARP